MVVELSEYFIKMENSIVEKDINFYKSSKETIHKMLFRCTPDEEKYYNRLIKAHERVILALEDLDADFFFKK